MLMPAEIIRAKSDALPLKAKALTDFIKGVTDGSVSDAQIAAFCMAVYCKGMSMQEQIDMTLAMRDSGRTLRWSDVNGPVLDKHSTGGVGDPVSLALAPLMAACGAYIPMISGRGLGHTGGTLDKLESIPGFDAKPKTDRFNAIVRKIGLAMTGQGKALAPADGRMYAIRDVTATVNSIPLIVSSILSKKLAEGLDGLVLDIKTGNGAFMCERNRARDLTAALVQVSKRAGLPCRALITDMNQPLSRNAGNALEVLEVIEYLKGDHREERFDQVVMGLSAEMLQLGGLAKNAKSAEEQLSRALDSGAAAEKFAQMVAMQGGPPDLLEHPMKYLPVAPVFRDFVAPIKGCIEYIDTRALGMCIVRLGGGRVQLHDKIDHSVGLSRLCKVGDMVTQGQPLATIHAASETDCEAATAELTAAIKIGRVTDSLPSVYEKY
jgi:thymidine phosphorylase